MKVLIVGNGQGSWTMRGKQLGERIGARVRTAPTPDDWAWCEIIVLVKNWGARFASEAERSGKPVVWDAVDFWRQPFDNGADETRAKQLLQNQLAVIRPTLTIGATQAMAAACHGAYLPHHAWRGLVPTPPRDDEAKTIAYQGNPLYLGRWKAALEQACASHRCRLVVDPTGDPDILWQADVVVALRDREWDGWMPREWKSGVKIANAIAAGRPVLSQPTAAIRELRPVHVSIDEVPSAAVVEWALESLLAPDLRAWAYDVAQQSAPALRLPAVADRYVEILAGLKVAS